MLPGFAINIDLCEYLSKPVVDKRFWTFQIKFTYTTVSQTTFHTSILSTHESSQLSSVSSKLTSTRTTSMSTSLDYITSHGNILKSYFFYYKNNCNA